MRDVAGSPVGLRGLCIPQGAVQRAVDALRFCNCLLLNLHLDLLVREPQLHELAASGEGKQIRGHMRSCEIMRYHVISCDTHTPGVLLLLPLQFHELRSNGIDVSVHGPELDVGFVELPPREVGDLLALRGMLSQQSGILKQPV